MTVKTNKNIIIDVTYYCGDFCVPLRYPLEKKTVEQLHGAWLFSERIAQTTLAFYHEFFFFRILFIAGMFSLFEGNKKIFFSRSGHLFRLAQARLISSSLECTCALVESIFSSGCVCICVCLPRARSALCCSSARAVHTHCVREVRKATALSLTHTAPGLGTRPSFHAPLSLAWTARNVTGMDMVNYANVNIALMDVWRKCHHCRRR